jgi:hypothetical protein
MTRTLGALACVLTALAVVALVLSLGHRTDQAPELAVIEGYVPQDTPAPESELAEPTPREVVIPEPEPEPVVSAAPAYEDASWFRPMGVTSFNSFRVSWYNPATLGTTHAALGLATVGAPITDRGDGIGVVDGLVAVALPSDWAYGTYVDTPFGAGVVVDHSQGAMDVVVWW